MEDLFEYILQVSGGWAKARLSLTSTTALIEYNSRFMGQLPIQYVLHCEHKKLSEYHGLLITTRIEQYETEPNEHGIHRFTGTKKTISFGQLFGQDIDEEMLEIADRFDIEYIYLPQPQNRLDEPDGNWDVYDRLETFSLILLIYFAGFRWAEDKQFEATPLGRRLVSLDKMQFGIAEGKYTSPV